MKSFLTTYGITIAISAIVCLAVGLGVGATALVTTVILAVLEISLSFDNAVVNAKVLKRMSPVWQRMFMTLGILIAVVGVRMILPIALVAILAHTSFAQVIDLALHHPKEYGEALLTIHPQIAAFGGAFLLLLFLDYLFDERDVLWLQPLEQRMLRLARFKGLGTVIVLISLLIATAVAGKAEAPGMLIAGIVGVALYSGIKAFGDYFGHGRATTAVAGAGFASFVYLEVLDASFSLDGVLGAFAITSDILVIAVGLGIGALWVRSITIHLVKTDALKQYRYLEHGAHYAIGVLALLLFASASFNISEIVTGFTGLIIIGAALYDSVRYNHKK